MNPKTLSAKTKLAFVFLLLAVTILITPYCKKTDDKKKEETPSGTKVKYTVMTNGSDPLFVEANRGGDTIIRAYGARDAAGKPQTLTDIMIAAHHDTTYYNFDSLHRLNYVQAPNGVQFHFTWLSNIKAAVTVLVNDGITQLTTSVDFAGRMSSSPNNGRVMKRSGKASLQFEPIRLPGISHQRNQTENVLVNAIECGGAATLYQVYVDVLKTDYTIIDRFPAYQLSSGQWGANIPSNIAPTINPSDICNDLVGVLGNGCTYLETPGSQALCPALSAAVASSGIGALIAGEIFVACESLIAGLELYCLTLGNEPAPGAPSMAEMLCEADVLDRTITFDVLLRAMTPGLPENIYSISKRVPGNGPYGTLNLNLGSNTAIRILELVPPIPLAQQDYTANAEVYCVTAGSVVKLSIVGTDGYTDELIYNITSNQQTGIFTLNVPGALTAGIQDVVTLEITLPDGKIITRKASLVFA